MKDLTAVCYGEVLWDVFPTHRKIGGAPLNVASRLQSFGINTTMISKVGNDPEGDTLIDYLKSNSVAVDCIQTDLQFPTGEVKVTLDEQGTASYNIEYPAAWDKIELTSVLKDRVSDGDVFVFGSLSCRDGVSKDTLIELIKGSKFSVLDANLRAPYYNKELLLELMNNADLIKLNDEEIVEICNFNNLSYSNLEDQIKAISDLTNTRKICVTLGAKGAILYDKDTFYYNTGIKVKVADTVGAGDSFLASLINNLLNQVPPQKALNIACAVGSLVASKDGANPKISEQEIEKMMRTKD